MHLLSRTHAMDMVKGMGLDSPPSPGLPFPITIGPEQAVAHRGWVEARDRALSVIGAGHGLVLVLGAPGSGKTLLLQEIARTLRAAGVDVILLPRGDLVLDLAETEMAAAGMGQRRRVVLIDEAHRMNEAALNHLGQFGRCAFVLAGMPDPGDEQPDGPHAGVVAVRLAALPPDEIGAFVAARLAQSGMRADLLSEAAVAQLAKHSGGVPRVLNMLAGAASFLARAERASCVEAVHVDQAAALRDAGVEIDAAGAALPIMPGVVPRGQTEPPSSPVMAPSAASLAAPPRLQAPRRRRIAALGMGFSIAAACAGIVAWQAARVPRTSPLMAARAPSPASPVPVAPVPAAAPAASSIAVPEAAPRQAATWQQPEPDALPSGAPAHVVVRYARESADPAAWAANLALTLRAAGLAVDALIPVSEQDARPGARYFFAEDQPAAEAALRAAGLAGKGTLTDARGVQALLRPGLIELTVPPGQLQVGNHQQPLGDGRS